VLPCDLSLPFVDVVGMDAGVVVVALEDLARTEDDDDAADDDDDNDDGMAGLTLPFIDAPSFDSDFGFFAIDLATGCCCFDGADAAAFTAALTATTLPLLLLLLLLLPLEPLDNDEDEDEVGVERLESAADTAFDADLDDGGDGMTTSSSSSVTVLPSLSSVASLSSSDVFFSLVTLSLPLAPPADEAFNNFLADTAFVGSLVLVVSEVPAAVGVEALSPSAFFFLLLRCLFLRSYSNPSKSAHDSRYLSMLR
jgi:hypothetical protein